MIANLSIGLFVVLYFAFSVFSIYFAVIGKGVDRTKPVGKMIYYHGVTWIIVMIATAVLTLCFVFGNVILHGMSLYQ